jgi:aldehyde dehydrogenase (NAD+)
MPTTDIDAAALVALQRTFFESGATRGASARRAALAALERGIRAAETAILEALRVDLGKSAAEAYASELGFALADLAHLHRHLRSWMRPARRRTPWLAQPGASWIVPEPRGVTLVVGPWNYPFQLAISPLIASLAAGNTVILKPSEHAPRTAAALSELVGAAFPPEHACVVTGDAATAAALLEQRLDHVFFTGSTAVGRIVAQAAARTLTPCTLELGGKSPCIVCADANLAVAARRIAWGKFMNCGQTCVAPDFILADRKIVAPLLVDLVGAVTRFYGVSPETSPDYGRIVSVAHFDRLHAMLKPGRLVHGGGSDRATRYIAPTILTDVPVDAPILHEEVFGPILPVLAYDDLDSALSDVRRRPTPLALYVFAEERATQDHILAETRSGGACVNDTALQILNPRLPFGGLGDSGLGAYHGRTGFDTFSHHRAVLRRGTRLDSGFRYPPARHSLRILKRLLPWLLR